MSAQERHRLVGLEPDNLLAFLTLLGLLRALDAARPDWRARAYWDVEARPLRPVLVLKQAQKQADVAAAAGKGIAMLAEAHDFHGKADLNYTREEARTLLETEVEDARAALLGALMSDGAVRENGTIWPSPFCFLFGQGHQHFLARLADIPRGILPAKLTKQRKKPDLTAPAYIEATLFTPWTRTDPTDGFRWDPVEDRRYALRADDPSGDPAGMQHGANRLAAVGLAALPGIVVRRRGEARFLNAGTRFGDRGDILISWPIWTVPARLHAIAAALSHPAMAGASEREFGSLARLGIAFAYGARRLSVGKFFNVTMAEKVGWARTEAFAPSRSTSHQ